MSEKKTIPPALLQRGRGAVSSDHSARFNMPLREADGDWLDEKEILGEKLNKNPTKVTIEYPKSILTFNKSPDIPFDRSINAYRGCEHGCIYCFARPTHAYHDLSPGLDFETKLFAKPNAVKLLRETLAKPKYAAKPIAIGTNTDPYQPIERVYQITRGILELMLETRHPIGITTKSDRVCNDRDLLGALAAQHLTAVAISVTTLDGHIARILEPRAPSPSKRLAAIRKLHSMNIPVHVNIAPVIPAITDHEIESIAKEAAHHGARSIAVIPVRLPHEVAPLFEEWLETHFPDRKQKVMSIIRSLRGGKRNDPGFHSRMRGNGPWAELLHTRVAIARRKYNLNRPSFGLRTDLFVPPTIKGAQLELF